MAAWRIYVCIVASLPWAAESDGQRGRQGRRSTLKSVEIGTSQRKRELDVRRFHRPGAGPHFSFHVGGKATKVRWGTGGVQMILAKLAGAALVVSIATGPLIDPKGSMMQLSNQQKNAAMQPLVRSATECIAQAVVGDARFRVPDVGLGDLIVDSMTTCLGPVRAMIDAY